MPAPDDDEVGRAIRHTYHDHRRQQARFVEQDVIRRRHHLLGVQTELDGSLFDAVYGAAVDVGLAVIAQTPVTGRNAKPSEQRP
jgi:hypothetical protein